MDIEKRVAAGQSDEEIKAHYVRDYSLRILAMPEGTRGQLLSWAPWLAGGGGIGVVAATLQRLRRPAFEPSSANPLPELPELD